MNITPTPHFAAPAHPQDLDWTQPLRAASSSARAAATAAVASRPLAAAYTPTSSSAAAAPTASSTTAPLSPETVGLVLGLLDDLIRGGQHDVARHLARPLLGGAVALGGEQLRRLTAIMAQVRGVCVCGGGKARACGGRGAAVCGLRWVADVGGRAGVQAASSGAGVKAAAARLIQLRGRALAHSDVAVFYTATRRALLPPSLPPSRWA